MPTLIHLLAAALALGFFSTVGYGFVRRLAVRDGSLSLVGIAIAAVLLMLPPFALATLVNGAFGWEATGPAEWLPYLLTALAFFRLVDEKEREAGAPSS